MRCLTAATLLAVAVLALSAAPASALCANAYGGDVISFACRSSNSSVEGLVIRCERGDASVRFYANVS